MNEWEHRLIVYPPRIVLPISSKFAFRCKDGTYICPRNDVGETIANIRQDLVHDIDCAKDDIDDSFDLGHLVLV